MLQKLCSVLSTVLLVVLLVLAAVLILPVVFGYQEMAVLTGSMEPTVPVGSLIYIKQAPPDTLQVGDVVTYRLEGDTMVTHRVVQVNAQQQSLVTQGDANDSPDGEIAFERVVGKMAFSLPYLGYLSINIRTKNGIIAVCGVLILIILLTFLPEIFAPEPKQGRGTAAKRAEREPPAE